jgi:hypothetical protein
MTVRENRGFIPLISTSYVKKPRVRPNKFSPPVKNTMIFSCFYVTFLAFRR